MDARLLNAGRVESSHTGCDAVLLVGAFALDAEHSRRLVDHHDVGIQIDNIQPDYCRKYGFATTVTWGVKTPVFEASATVEELTKR